MSKVLIALYILTTSSALIALKYGAKSGAPIQYLGSKLQFNLNPYVIAGIVLYGTSFLIYTYLISKYNLGYIIPLTTALVYVLIFAASFVIFNEAFTALKIMAISLIMVGAILLNIKS